MNLAQLKEWEAKVAAARRLPNAAIMISSELLLAADRVLWTIPQGAPSLPDPAPVK